MQIKLYRSFLLTAALICCLTAAALAQSRIVTGTVKDPNGTALPGVTVLVKGTANGTSTDGDGKYSIEVNGNDAIIVFSFIGFASLEAPVGNQTTIAITLKEDTTQLQEVVVTALGVERDSKAIGYAVTKVDGGALTQARETNVINSLEGRVAGVNISGTPGGAGSSSSIVIRGMTSVNGSTPLFVINGVPMDNTTRGMAGQYGGADYGDGIANLNPDDIKEVTVLKGAAASALYGSRAAGGVIVITTKSGKDRKGFGVEYNTNLVVDQAINYKDFQTQYGQGSLGAKPTDANSAYQSGQSSWGAPLDGSSVVNYDGVSRPYTSQVKSNFKNFYKAGTTFTNTISIGNSNENGSYRFSASDLNNKGIIPNSGLSKQTFNLNINYKILSKLTFDLVSNYIKDSYLNRPGLSDSPGNANAGILFLPTSLSTSALVPGSGSLPNGNEANFSSNTYATNPYFAAYKFINNTTRDRYINVATLRYSITDWLTLQGRFANDTYFDRYFNVTPSGTAYLNTGGLVQTDVKGVEQNADFLLTANKKVTNDITITASAGGNLRKASYENTVFSGNNFAIPFLYTEPNIVAKNPQGYLNQKKEVQSWYYTAEFNYRNILFVNTTGRQDKFSVLDGKSLFYPAVSTSLVFSELASIPKMSYGKIRASYSTSTGDPGSPYQTGLYYSIAGSNNGHPIGSINNGNGTGYGFGNLLPNSNLKPYNLTELELGVDLRFFENRLALDATYYNRQTTKDIVYAQTSGTSGFNSAALNLGSMENKGVELMLRGTPIKTSNFAWNISLNYTHNANTVKALIPGQTDITVPGGISRTQNAFINMEVGKQAAQVMAFDYARDPATNQILYQNGVPMQGALKAYGSGYHPNIGGVLNEFNYKGFNFGFLIDYKFGGHIFSATNSYAYLFGLHKNTLPGRSSESITGVGIDQATGATNTVSATPQAYYGGIQSNVSSTFVYDASFVKLRQVIFGYRLPSEWFAKTPIKGATFSW